MPLPALAAAPIVRWLWDNKQIIAEIICGIIIAGLIWWYGFHNPAKIKKMDAQIVALKAEVQNAHDAINLLTTIEARHEIITKISYRNISTIRYAPKPGRDGLFVPGGVFNCGVLPAVP